MLWAKTVTQDLARILPITERKKWSRNGSTVEPFSSPQDGPHLGTVLVPFWKRFSNMIIKEKMAPPYKVVLFYKTFWLNFFSQWYLWNSPLQPLHHHSQQCQCIYETTTINRAQMCFTLWWFRWSMDLSIVNKMLKKCPSVHWVS